MECVRLVALAEVYFKCESASFGNYQSQCTYYICIEWDFVAVECGQRMKEASSIAAELIHFQWFRSVVPNTFRPFLITRIIYSTNFNSSEKYIRFHMHIACATLNRIYISTIQYCTRSVCLVWWEKEKWNTHTHTHSQQHLITAQMCRSIEKLLQIFELGHRYSLRWRC